MPLLTLDLLSDLSVFTVDYLPIILAVAFLIALMMWALAHLSRYFEYLKMLESPYFDKDTLDFIHKVLQAVWVGFVAILILFLLQYRIPQIREGLVAFVNRLPALFFITFVLFIAVVLVRSLHRFASFLRGDLKVKPRKLAPPRALSFTEIFLKYLIYAISGVIAFVGGIAALPEDDRAYKDLLIQYIRFPDAPVVLGFVIAIVTIFVAAHFVDSLFEDMKKRSRKFAPRVVDELKATARYAVYILGAVVILILAVDLLLQGDQLIVFTVVIVFSGLVLTLVGFEAMRNGLAGVTVMLANPFDSGDRIKVGDGQEFKVESIGLMTTQMRTLGGELVSFPNAEIMKRDILNLTRSASGTIVVNISMDFSVPIRKVHTALLDAAQKTTGLEQNPPPQIVSRDIRGMAIIFQLTAHTKDVLRAYEIKSELIANIQEMFHLHGMAPVVSEI